MSEKKPTPGPWVAVPDWMYDRLEIRDKDGRRIAVCMKDFPMSTATHDANAYLLAAAWEMLAVLEDIANELHVAMMDMQETGFSDGSSLPASLQLRLRDVIDKAKGASC